MVRPLVLAVALLPCVVPVGVAQGVPARDTTAQRIEPREVRGERGAIVVGGASAFVLRPDSARTAVSASLADVLRTVPLVLVRTNSRGEVELSVRGSESRQVGIMLDGLPLSAGWDGRTDASLVPMSGISQLTYVRATSTVLGGPNTLGGVIDLQVDSPLTHRLEPRLSLGSDITGARLASAGLADARTRGDGSRVAWRVGGGLRQLDGIVRARGVPDPVADADLRTNTDARSVDAFGAMSWRSAGGAGLSGIVSGYDAARGVAPEVHLNAPRLWRYPEQSRRMAQLRAYAPAVTTRAGRTTVEASGGVLAGRTQIDNYTDATYTQVNGRERGDEEVTSLRVSATQALPGGSRLRAAVTSNRVRYDETLGANPASRYRQGLLSAGVEAQTLVGTRTLLSAGIVQDRAETFEAGGKEPLGPRSLLGWRVGATVQATAWARWHASASRRARFPALRELYSGALNRFEPNPALRPERLLATEAGVSLGNAVVPDGVTAQVTAFHHWLEDGVVRVGVPGTNRFTRVNRDDTRSIGVEALVGWRAHADGPSFTLDVVAQRVRVSDVLAGTGGERPEHMPGLRAMLDATVPVGRGVAVGAAITHLGSQYCVNPEVDAAVDLAAQTVGSLTAQRTWRIAGAGFGAMRVVAGLDNVTNAAVYEQCGLPRAGRTLRLGVDLR